MVHTASMDLSPHTHFCVMQEQQLALNTGMTRLQADNQCVRDAGLQTVSLFVITFGSQSDGLSYWLDV